MEELENLGKISVDIEGKIIECDVVTTFECEELNKMYVIYTNHEKEEDGKERLYVNSYDPLIGLDKLNPVTTPEEIEMIEEVLQSIAESN